MNIPTPEELEALNENSRRPILTNEAVYAAVAFDNNTTAVHAQLEDLTPPEALEVLKVVVANHKAEVRDFNEDQR